MIFNSEYNSEYDNMVVTESPYPLGLEGALMHVYENECNYNAMMKAVGISELRYYQETGGDLFVQEAGAFGGFIEKAKAFFKKVIEKIKQIFHKFMAVINQYAMSDKKFVKTYSKELMRRDYTDFEVEGYTFDGIDKIADNFVAKVLDDYSNAAEKYDSSKSEEEIKKQIAADLHMGIDAISTPDKVNDTKEVIRANLYEAISGNSASSMDESEFREEVRGCFYGNDGDKDTIEVGIPEIRKWLGDIETSEKDIRAANKIEKGVTRDIGKMIKALEKSQNELAKFKKEDKPEVATAKNETIKLYNNIINIAQSISNDATVTCGLLVQALKDRNRQSKAFCVKALSYKNKNESARLYESSYSADDIFAGVVIR